MLMSNYKQLYKYIENWLKLKPENIDEKTCQLSFYIDCMKVYYGLTNDKLKYCDNFHGTVFKHLFERLIPDFCLIDNYNSNLKSKESGLDLEFLPCHIVSILEIKKKMKTDDIGQLIHYLQIVLDYSPSCRKFIIGAITDFQDIRFGKVSRTNNDYEFLYEASICVTEDKEKYLLNYLTTFFTIDSSQLGFKRLELFPKGILIHNQLLGIGANSLVFNCLTNPDDKNNEYTLKISNKSVDREVFIYKKLYGDKYKIEKVSEYIFLFLHAPGKMISKENLLNRIDTVWTQIKQAHRYKILHRDIRKSNIIEIWNHQNASTDILLIDWESSVEIGFSGQYRGTLSTASKFILNELINKRYDNIQCLPIDDCISFMKMILLEIIPEIYPKAISLQVKNGSYSGINVIYEEIYDKYENKQLILLKIITFLETEAYRSTLKCDMLHSYIDQCIQRKYCLCQVENSQLDIDYFDQLEKDLLSS
ncbi:unnamed protein product [Rotaria sp. Silwood1]|nr:unnamed protein product [Rotaria sp. Silwood1]CAF1629511.1 unnamed protein product [Rotaria sp. Silwood1]